MYYEGEGSHLWSLFQRVPDVLSKLEAYGFHRFDFKDSSWEDENIPSSNNVRGGKHEGYQGVAWYRRLFSIPDEFEGMYVRLVSEDNVLNPCPSRFIKNESSHIVENVEAIAVESRSINLPEFLLIIPCPRFWSTDNVNLYIVEAELESIAGIDGFSTLTGLRFVEKSNTGILLNGEPIFPKRLARHEDYPCSGRSLKPEEIFRGLKLIKDSLKRCKYISSIPLLPSLSSE